MQDEFVAEGIPAAWTIELWYSEDTNSVQYFAALFEAVRKKMDGKVEVSCNVMLPLSITMHAGVFQWASQNIVVAY